MNFLAHLYLSGDNPKVMVGNFIGDFVKGGRHTTLYDPEIVLGITLHRFIDSWTDAHPIVAQSKNRLRPTYRHYAGVIIDIFYDHYLARNWDKYHSELLPDFAERAYALVESHLPILPEKVKFLLPYMVKGNWLVSYARLEGIHKALTGMSHRTTFASGMENAIENLTADYEAFQWEFEGFFPELKEKAAAFLEEARNKQGQI